MITTKVTTVNPQQAAALLETNTFNRTPRKGVVDRYARDMAAGKWKVNGEAIKVSSEGVLLDGQHRLMACVKANVSFQTVFITGLSSGTFDTIDTGAPRMFRDVMQLKQEKYSALRSTFLRSYWFYLRNPTNPNNGGVVIPTFQELETLNGRIDDNLFEEAARLFSTKNIRRYLTPSVGMVCYYLFGQLDRDLTRLFFNALDTGEGLNATDPVFRLRERLINARMRSEKISGKVMFAFLIKSWNATRKSKPLNNIRWSDTDVFPIPE